MTNNDQYLDKFHHCDLSMNEWIDKTSIAPKFLYNKLRGASNQIIVKNHA